MSGLVHEVLEHLVQVGLLGLHAGLAHVYVVAARERERKQTLFLLNGIKLSCKIRLLRIESKKNQLSMHRLLRSSNLSKTKEAAACFIVRPLCIYENAQTTHARP